MESWIELVRTFWDVQRLINVGGIFLIGVTVFIETGILLGLFLPGDSLLISAGIFAATGHLNLTQLLIVVPLCAVLGDQLGYFIGRKAGQSLYRAKNRRWLRASHIHRAKRFFARHGAKALMLSRFIPVVRTLLPPTAGAAGMPYKHFVLYGFVGAVLWSSSMVSAGYFLGHAVPGIEDYLHEFMFTMVIVGTGSSLIAMLRARRASSQEALDSVSK